MSVPRLNLSLVPSTRDDQHPVERLKKEKPDLFNALISPRYTERPKLKDDFEAFEVISKAYKYLMKPFVRSYNNDIAGRQHRDQIERNKAAIHRLKERLFTVNLLGPRNSKNKPEQLDLCGQYVQKLFLVCDDFLREYNKIEVPNPPSELLSPRRGVKGAGLEQAQAQFRDRFRHAQNLQDSIVQQSTAHICGLAKDYASISKQIEGNVPEKEESKQSSVTLRQRIKSAYERITSPRSRSRPSHDN